MRSRKQILIWLIEKGYTQSQISIATNTSTATVSLTISGHRNNRAVLDWLREHGCPEAFLIAKEMVAKSETVSDLGRVTY